jgi:hypothetical protein
MERIFQKNILGVFMLKKSIIMIIILWTAGLTFIQAQTNNNGIVVPGDNLAAKLVWLQRSADSHNTYIVEVKANENVSPHIFEYKSAINIIVILKGDNNNRTLRLRTHGTMFTINSDVTLILDNNVTIQGHKGNNNAMIIVNGGTLKMNSGAAIIGNQIDTSNTGGVYVASGNFEMNGGTIADNSTTYWWGGGVQVGEGTFEMKGGTISGNTASYGGGVQVYHENNKGGTFIMSGGTIIGNTARMCGGGVYVNGDVYGSCGGTFSMIGGNITGNTANKMGGGVFVHNNQSNVPTAFTKTGGTITGYNSDQKNGNVVKDDDGVLARMGHAVCVSGDNIVLRRKETTAGADVKFSVSWTDINGDWEK